MSKDQKIEDKYVEVYNNKYLKDLDKKLKLVPLTYDQMFKRLFANNEDMLKRFLITVLKLKLKKDRCKIKIVPNEPLKDINKQKGSRLDIIVILNKTIRINIEVNTEDFKDIKDRNVVFNSKSFTTNIPSGTGYSEFYRYESIQLNLNTKPYYTEKNGEDEFYITSKNTGDKLVDNFVIVIKNLAYFRDLYYNGSENCKEDVVWLAMITSKSFTELGMFLDKLVTKKEKDKFLKEAIEMSEEFFFPNFWKEEEMKQIVEGRKAYNQRLWEEEKKKTREEWIRKEDEFNLKSKELNDKSKELNDKSKELESDKKELEKKEEILEKKEKEIMNKEINSIKVMLENNIDASIISKATGKSLKEIKRIENNILK